MSKPPSIILKEGYGKLAGEQPSSDYINQMARETLLSPHEVEMWFDHLKVVSDNRKRAAAKAAATRKKKRALQQSGHQTEVAELLEAQTPQQVTYYCGVCHDQYVEFSDKEENWIGCDQCDAWYHFACAGIQSGAIPDEFYCEDCERR